MVPALSIDDNPYPRRAHNRVIPLIDGHPFYARLQQAFRAARERIWAIVSFIEPAFSFADGTSWWDLLDECSARGVEVRLLFWRNPAFFSTAHVFQGDGQTRQWLDRRGTGFLARWDGSPDAGHCHHQKAFVIDAGQDDAIAFVGGMVLSRSTLAWPGHEGPGKHDVFVELMGPVVTDAISNFIERWNHASMDDAAPPYPDDMRAGDIARDAFAAPLPPAGEVPVQLSRTVRPGIYPSIPAGEDGIWRQYQAAFRAARRTIYIENQHPGELQLLRLMHEALARGVHIIQVVPEEPMGAIYDERTRGPASPYAATFAWFERLREHDGFTLVGYAQGPTYRPVYVHAKVCIVDGEWVTCGSANLVDLSLSRDHTELNAAFWHRPTGLAMLEALLGEHGPLELSGGDDLVYLQRAASLARENAARRSRGEPMRGLANALDPRTYALR